MATATGVYEPVSVAIDSDENMYIGEGMPIGIRRVDSLTNVVDKVITGLPGDQSASLAAPGPLWVAVGKHGLFSIPNPAVIGSPRLICLKAMFSTLPAVKFANLAEMVGPRPEHCCVIRRLSL